MNSRLVLGTYLDQTLQFDNIYFNESIVFEFLDFDGGIEHVEFFFRAEFQEA